MPARPRALRAPACTRAHATAATGCRLDAIGQPLVTDPVALDGAAGARSLPLVPLRPSWWPERIGAPSAAKESE